MDIPQTSYGIQALIERLRGEGIEAGRLEAAQLLEQAKHEIDLLRQAAHDENEGLLRRTREQTRIEQEASIAAIELAFRDSVLRLREAFMHHFADRLRRRVRTELADPDLLRQMLAQVMAQVMTPQAQDAPWQQALDTLTQDTTQLMLAEGIELHAHPGQAGVRICLTEQNLEVHFTEDAASELLLEHLLPRVRRQLDGAPDPQT